VGPYAEVLLDNVNIIKTPVCAVCVGMIALSISGLSPLSPLRWVLLISAVLGGVLILAGVLTAVSAVGFRIHHRGSAIGLVYQSAVFGRYPLDVFPIGLQRLLTFGLPFGFIAFFPASYCAGRSTYSGFAFAQPLIAVIVFGVGLTLWRLGLQTYRSTGT